MNSHSFLSRGLKAGALLIAGAASLLAFEGRIDMKMTAPKMKEPMTMHYLYKGNLVRAEVPASVAKKGKEGNLAVTLLDMGKLEVTTLLPGQKMYMTNKLPASTTEQIEKQRSENPFKATGRKEVIAGIEAVEYAGQTGKTWTEIWVTKEFGAIITAEIGKTGVKTNAWDSFLNSESYCSLRTISRLSKDGDEVSRVEVVKLEKATLDAALFVPPADYTKMEIPNVGGMLKGLMK